MTKRKKKRDKVIAVCGSRVLVWADGAFAGDAEFLALVRGSISDELSVWVGRSVLCSSNTAEGAIAAMLSVRNTVITDAPYDLLIAYELRIMALLVKDV